MKSHLVAVIFSVLFATSVYAGQARPEFTSPDSQHSIKLTPNSVLESEPDRGEMKVLSKHEILATYPILGSITDVFWSPENKYAAAENRWANGGD